MSDQSVSFTNEEIRNLAEKTQVEAIPALFTSADESFISVFISSLTNHHTREWKQKLFAVIEQLNQISKLELAGSILSSEQFLEVLQLSSKQLLPIAKLFPLVVGMPQKIFEEILRFGTSDQLKVLENENLKEPIQHHLKLYAIKESAVLKNFYVNLENLEAKVRNMHVQELDFEDLNKIENELEGQQEDFKRNYDDLSKALRLAWICGRGDIVETLSENHEICDKILKSIFGICSDGYSSKNIYQKLHHKLEGVFVDPFADKHNKNDPAIEGIMHFPIHLQDYWNLGLIPGHEDSIASSGHLSIQELKVDQIQHLDKIYEEIQHNLEKKGLKTIADLEHHKIYSKNMLYEYLRKQHLNY